MTDFLHRRRVVEADDNLFEEEPWGEASMTPRPEVWAWLEAHAPQQWGVRQFRDDCPFSDYTGMAVIFHDHEVAALFRLRWC